MLNTKPFYTEKPKHPSFYKTNEQLFEEHRKDPIKKKLYRALRTKGFYKIYPWLLMSEDVYKKSSSNPIITSHSIIDYATAFVKYEKGYRDLVICVEVNKTDKTYTVIIKDFISREIIKSEHTASLGNRDDIDSFELFIRPLCVDKSGSIVVIILTETFIESMERKVAELKWKK